VLPLKPPVTTPRISVVLAVRNGERHLEASLRSILGQSAGDFELIVVDDGSTDGTGAILVAIRQSDPRVVVIRQGPRGLTASLNRGLEAARGEYVARQDADDVSVSDRFARQAAHLDAHRALAAVGSAADVIDRHDRVVARLDVALGAEQVREGLLSLRSTPVHGSMMMRRSGVAAVGGYREAFPVCQDYDLWLRLTSRFDIENLGAALYQWRLAEGSAYATRRAVQLKYAAIALAFARERSETGHDSYELLESCGGDLDRFAAGYRLGPFMHAMWGELLLRGLGNSADVRKQFRRALARGYVRPWTMCLLGWTHLGLPWPGGRPLAPAEGTERL
jgi:CTP:molybdopterin cytidylyltransferase MocA